MIGEMTSHQWALWATIAVVSGLIEVAIPSFSFIFAAFASLITAFVALMAPYSKWPVQIATFVVVLFLSVLFLRPRLVEKIHSGKKIFSRTDSLLNQEGVVTETVDSDQKRVRVLVAGQDWSALSEGEVAVGKKIKVIGSDGIVLKVKEI